MAISDNYVPLVYRRQNNKSPTGGYTPPVNLGLDFLPAFPANTYPINKDTEPVNALLYAISNIINPINKTQAITPLQVLADSIPKVPFREKTGYEWGMPSYIPKDTPDSYGTITDGDKSVTVDSTGISGSGSTSGKPAKKQAPIAVAPKGLSKITSEIAPVQVARPDYTGAAYGSQAQPVAQVQPAESPIDESYYRYLRNNGWNDFDARRQAVRYY